MALLLNVHCTTAEVPISKREEGPGSIILISPNFCCKLYPNSNLGDSVMGRGIVKKKNPLYHHPLPQHFALQELNYSNLRHKGEMTDSDLAKSLPTVSRFSSNFKHSVFNLSVPISIYSYPKPYSLKPGIVWNPVKMSFCTSDVLATSEAHL